MGSVSGKAKDTFGPINVYTGETYVEALAKAKEKPAKGEVIAVGKGKILENGDVRPLDVKVGDKVLFGKYSGTEVPGDENLLSMREDDIIAVIEK